MKSEAAPPASLPPPGLRAGLGWVAFALLAADLDLLTKGLVPADSILRPIEVIPGLFNIRFAHNYLGIWSLPIPQPLLILIILVAVVFLGYHILFARGVKFAARLAMSLILGGALGNLTDRLCFGFVRDFIDVDLTWLITDFHWPTFNVADIFICVGAPLLALMILREKPPT